MSEARNPVAAAGKTQKRRRRKFVRIACGTLLVVFVAVLFYDSRPDGYDDLLPVHSMKLEPGRGQTGFGFLKMRWSNRSPIPWPDRMRAAAMGQDKEPWQEAFAERMRSPAELLKADVETALERPAWILDGSSGLTMRSLWFLNLAGILRFDCRARVKSGDRAGALAVLEDLRRLSVRQIGNSQDLRELLVGVYLRECAASACCDWMDREVMPPAELPDWMKTWEEEPLTAAVLRETLRGTVAIQRYEMETGRSYGWSFVKGENPFAVERFFLFKKNISLNGLHGALRGLEKGLLEVSPSFEKSCAGRIAAALPSTVYFFHWVHPNAFGRMMLEYDVKNLIRGQVQTGPYLLFITRAMRVRLALARWQWNHPGHWPVRLEELVPDFLSSVPADPWTGELLRWDAGTRMLYAVGSDWKSELPQFPAKKAKDWFSADPASPGLRIARPGS